MCPMADVCEPRYRLKKRTSEKSEGENLLKMESVGKTENVSLDEEYLLETCSAIKKKETIPAKNTVLHTEKESTILKTEENPIKPWYITHI